MAPLGDSVLDEQQKVADRFHALGLIPEQDRRARHRLEVGAPHVSDSSDRAGPAAFAAHRSAQPPSLRAGTKRFLTTDRGELDRAGGAPAGLAGRFAARPASLQRPPAPSEVLDAAWRLTLNGELLNNIAVSAKRAATGFVIGGSLAFGFGLLNGVSRIGEKLTDTTFQMVRNIPNLAMVPLVILWFGIEDGARVFPVALGVFFPIYINTFHGIRTADAQLVEMGRSPGMSNWELFRRVILPGALPSIFVGFALFARHHVA